MGAAPGPTGSEEESVDRIEALALDMRTGFAEMRGAITELRTEIRDVRTELRTSNAEIRADVAALRAELADQRTQQAERHGTLLDAIADLRNEYRGHTHGD